MGDPPTKILLATDGSASSAKAARRAARVATRSEQSCTSFT
jgi:nucleotide-binding universal stress UspA family protein